MLLKILEVCIKIRYNNNEYLYKKTNNLKLRRNETLNKKLISKGLKTLNYLLFMLYLIILANVIIFKNGSALHMSKHYRTEIPFAQWISGMNFIPLKTIIPYLKGEPSAHIALENLLGNILAFSPLGFLLPIIFLQCKEFKNIFWISLGTSLLIEILQLVFYLGSCDIDDLILNIFGSLLGFGLYCFFRYFYRREVEVNS